MTDQLSEKEYIAIKEIAAAYAKIWLNPKIRGRNQALRKLGELLNFDRKTWMAIRDRYNEELDKKRLAERAKNRLTDVDGKLL